MEIHNLIDQCTKKIGQFIAQSHSILTPANLKNFSNCLSNSNIRLLGNCATFTRMNLNANIWLTCKKILGVAGTIVSLACPLRKVVC